MYEGLVAEINNMVRQYQELYKVIPHVCSCCVGCENKKADNSGCEVGFVPSAEKISKIILNTNKKEKDKLLLITPWDRKDGDIYWYIASTGEIYFDVDKDSTSYVTEDRYYVGNYCRDKAKAKQRALKETISRLLWRYGESRNGIAKEGDDYWVVSKDINTNEFVPNYLNHAFKCETTCFATREFALSAINDVVIPFTKAYPEFIW